MKNFAPILRVMILVLFWTGAQAQSPYCTPAYSSGCSFGDGLTGFQVGTIIQTIPCSGSPSAWYHDYTTLSANVQPGVPVPVIMKAGYSSTYVTIWIDLNNNNAFEASEKVLTGYNCASSGTNYTATITIPAGTAGGNHRLRFRTCWLSAPADPCVTYTYGNAADFTLNIMAPAVNLKGTVTNCCNGTPVQGATVSCGGKNTTTAPDGSYSITGIAAGTYSATCQFPPNFLPVSAPVTIGNSGIVVKDFCLDPDPPLAIDAGPDQMVFLGYAPSACATLSWSGEYGGTPPYVIRWSTGETNRTITVCPATSTVYTVTITDANRCTFTDQVRVCVIDIRCGNPNNPGKKVLICHFPPGNRDNPQTICVDTAAVNEHVTLHGDLLGPAGIDRTCPR